MRKYKGMPIVKEMVAFGVGGQLTRDDGFPELPERARVAFSAEADYENIKYKVTAAGVHEILILTIDAKSFEVTNVSSPPPEPEQTTIDGDGDTPSA